MPRRRADTLALILAAILLPGPAAGQEAEMETLVVEGSPDEVEPEGAETQFPTVVDLAPERARVQGVSDVLRRAVGVTVRDFGGLGSFATLSLRGSSSNQVRIFVDGVPLDDPITGTLNVNDVRLDNLERVEVYRGFTPLSLGSPSIGGAVNFVTRPVAGDRVEVLAGGGSFGTFRGSVSAAKQLGAHGLAASLSGFSTDGDFEFLDDNGTPFNEDDDEVVERVNNERVSLGGLLKYRGFPIGVPEVQASVQVFHKDEGVPGIGSFQSEDAEFRSTRVLSQAGISDYGSLVSNVETTLRGFHVHQRDRFRDPGGEVGLGTQDTRDTTETLGADGTIRHYVFGKNRFGLTGRGSLETFEPEGAGGQREGIDAERSSFEGGVEDELQLAAGRVRLLGSVSVQHAVTERGADDRDDTLASPRVGARWDVTREISVRANGGRFYRLPTFLELFGDTGTILGNPELESEEGWSGDLGARWSPPAPVRLTVTGFAYRTRDLIVFEQNSQRTSIAQNVSRAEGLGIELSGLVQVGPVELEGNATFQRIQDRSDTPFLRGNELPGRPGERGFLRARTVGFPIEPFVEIDLTGENYLDRANLVRTPARSIFNVGLRVDLALVSPVLTGTEILVEGRNVSDERILDVAGFPLPGRMIFASLRWEGGV